MKETELTMDVWIAEKHEWHMRELLGIYSKPEKARKVCQDEANRYFGERNTPPLEWRGDDGYADAASYDPGYGNVLYHVTRITVDDERSD